MTRFINGRPWGLSAKSVTMANKGSICTDHGVLKKSSVIGHYDDGAIRCTDCAIKWWEENKTHKDPMISQCRICFAPIIWGRTPQANIIAVNSDPDPNGLVEIIDDEGTPVMIHHAMVHQGETRYTEHSETCSGKSDHYQ